jgi:hypothetical protein
MKVRRIMKIRSKGLTRFAARGGATVGVLAAVAALTCLAAAPTKANTIPVTYISGKGTDSGTCASPATPCRTFQFAVNQTAPGGEVKALDPGVGALSAGPTLAQQKGFNSSQRKKIIQTPVLPLAPGVQSCAAPSITLPNSVPTSTGLTVTVSSSSTKIVALTFSTEITAPSGGNVVLDYSIDGTRPVPIGPEFFADDSRLVTRTAHGITKPPFTGPLPAGSHTITPFLTAFGGDGFAFFRCFSAVE